MSNSYLELSNAISDAVEKAGKSTLQVNARERIPSSGIAFGKDLVLTADHTLEREDDISVGMPDGTQLKAVIAGRDSGTDMAVLRLEKALAFPAELSKQARVGQIVLALGRPTDGGIEASLGTLSAISGPIRTHSGILDRYYRTDTTPYPGFSGGPLVDAEGKILGINTSGFGRGTSITIPIEIAWKLADELAINGAIKRGYLGIRSQPVELNPAAQSALKREQSTGLLIVGLEPLSPAEKGGLLVGDILVGLKGYAISDHDELMANLTRDVVGSPTPVDVLRGGLPQIINIMIEERKPEAEHQGHPQQHNHGRR